MLQKLKQKKFARLMLVSLYGVNICTANKIIGLLALHPQSKGTQLMRKKYATRLGPILDSLRIGFRLRLIVFSRMCLQRFLGTYRGLRLIQGLPTKGQRTHTNGKTTRRLKAHGTNLPFNIKLSLSRRQAIERTRNAVTKKKKKKISRITKLRQKVKATAKKKKKKK